MSLLRAKGKDPAPWFREIAYSTAGLGYRNRCGLYMHIQSDKSSDTFAYDRRLTP
jgi:hypothetical protein